MSQIANFFSEYWVVILILVILVVVLAAIRAVRKVMKEGGGAFNMETIRKNSEPNREVIRYKGKATIRDADVVCEVKGNRVVPKREDLSLFRAAFKSKFKAAVFLVEKENKIAYFFCKTGGPPTPHHEPHARQAGKEQPLALHGQGDRRTSPFSARLGSRKIPHEKFGL